MIDFITQHPFLSFYLLGAAILFALFLVETFFLSSPFQDFKKKGWWSNAIDVLLTILIIASSWVGIIIILAIAINNYYKKKIKNKK